MKNNITYKVNISLELEEMLDLYHHCALDILRPLDDKRRMQAMIDNADLAIHEDDQQQSIGKQLVKEVQGNTDKQSKIVLLAAPSAVGYYPNLGFEQHHQAWILSQD